MAQDSSNITDITKLINDALEADREEMEEAEYECTDEDWIPRAVGTGGQGVNSVGGHQAEGDWDNGSHGLGSTVYALSTIAFACDSSQADMESMPPSISAPCSLRLSGSETTNQTRLFVETEDGRVEIQPLAEDGFRFRVGQ